MKTPPTIVVGYTVKLRSPQTYRDHLSIKPPGNLRKPESVAAWRNDPEKQKEAWRKIDAIAPWVKLTGTIASVAAVDLHNREFMHVVDDSTVDPGTAFVNWLLMRHTFPPHGRDNYPITVFGFTPKPLLRLAGMAAKFQRVYVPEALWYSASDDHVRDPMEMLLEREVKDQYPVEKLFGETPHGAIALPPAYVQHENAMTDMRLAVELYMAWDLFPAMADVSSWDLESIPGYPAEQAETPQPAIAEETEAEPADEAKEAPAASPPKKSPKKKAAAK